jgi:hypothetical protein
LPNPNSDRAKSLNPVIYPSWWGDGESEPRGVGKNTF